MKKIPNALRKAWNWCRALIPSIPSGKLLYCILGLLSSVIGGGLIQIFALL